MKKKHRLAGKPVYIVWRDPDHDWHNFTVLDASGGFVLLQGEEEDGAKHDGIPFWVPMREAKSIRIRRT
jgi:hypothetical protein